MTFSRHDIVVFGFPVYGGRILHEALEQGGREAVRLVMKQVG